MSDWRDVEVRLHRSRGSLDEVYVEQFDSLKVCVDSCMLCGGGGSSFEFNLRKVVDVVDFSGFVGEPGEAFSLLAINEVPMSPLNLVESLLTGTVEGQQLLEFVVAEYTNWEVPLDLSCLSRESEEDVVWFADFARSECITSGEGGRYEPESEFEQRMGEESPFSDFFGVPCGEQVSYVLRLRDEKWRDWFYVGESSNILSRMQTHMKCGGDFSKRSCECDVRIVEVDCVRSDISERGLYDEVVSEYDVPEKRVLGGM